ncbi:hypothetical protein BDL97_15G033600 [Sphagnum fallax]|nr:hypothetical protein BDL97_15G033600 [Sphagnum fallax]
MQFFAKNRNNGPVSSYVWLQSFENGCCFQGLGFSLNNGLFEDQNKRNGHPHKLSLVSILCVCVCASFLFGFPLVILVYQWQLPTCWESTLVWLQQNHSCSNSWSDDTLQVCPTMDLPTTTICACSSSIPSIMAVALMARSSYQMVLRTWSPHKHFQVLSEFMLHIGHCTSDTRYDQLYTYHGIILLVALS